MPKEQVDVESFLTQLLQRINEIEEKTMANKNKIDILSNTILKKGEKVNEEIKIVKDELNKLKDNLDKIKERVDYIINELPNLARKEDLTAIERFIRIWEPLKFATLEDVERIINAKIEELKEKQTFKE